MTMLFRTQYISCTSYLQITHGYLKARPQIGKFANCRQTLLCHFLQYFIPAIHQKGVGCSIWAPHPPSKLVKLGKSKLIRIMDNHGIHIRNIKSCFYNSRRHKHINLSVYKSIHNFFKLPFWHPAMCIWHGRLRGKLCHIICNFINIAYTVIYIIYLSASCKLPRYCLTDHLIIVLADVGLNWQSVYRRLLQDAHISYPYQTHMKCPWYRRCGQCQHIHILLELLNLLLVGDTKALLFIHNQESQILKLHILWEQPMCADHNIHQTFF